MRKVTFFAAMILFLSIAIPAMAVPPPPPPPVVRVSVPLPPPIVFPAPPEVIVVPETEVYVVPSVREEIFFSNGYWWRPWNGRWYRSLYYDRGWGVYGGIPVWYRGFPHDWRENYRIHIWGGHPWNYRPIAHADLQRNWRTWHNTHHWDKPEHREFTHRHDGKPYTGHEVDKARLHRDSHVSKGTVQGRPNTKVVGPKNVDKSTSTGKGKLGTGGQVTTGTKVHNQGQSVGSQHGTKGVEKNR